MSQKIIIPKGTIDSTHTTIIEIPNYLHETSTVVVTTPRTTDSTTEGSWGANEYAEEAIPEQNESNWEQEYDAQETNEEQDYSPEQQEEYEDVEPNEDEQQQQSPTDQSRSYANYVQEAPVPQPRRPKHDQYTENMKRTMDKKRELVKLRAERQRMLEGEIGTYEVPPLAPEVEDHPMRLSEVPEAMRGRSLTRDGNYERKRRQQFERYQPPVGYDRQYPSEQGPSKYMPEMPRQRYVPNPRQGNQQWNPDIHGYPEMQYASQAAPLRHPVGQPVRQSGQMDFVRDDMRQFQQRSRRKPAFSIPRN